MLNAALAHHGDVPATTPYTPIIMAADAISASRPGARRESLERYVKRLRDLEELAMTFDGVRQAYAIQAGREVRVIVDAKLVDDKHQRQDRPRHRQEDRERDAVPRRDQGDGDPRGAERGVRAVRDRAGGGRSSRGREDLFVARASRPSASVKRLGPQPGRD